jgi:hypothetical protein
MADPRSKEDPLHVVRSGNSGGTAVHKPSALIEKS